MSTTWTILKKKVTGETQYVTAAWLTDGGADASLTTAQPVPGTEPPTVNAVTATFDTSGYGNGVTLSYQIASGSNTQVVLDTNNDVTGLSLIINQLLNSTTQNVTDANNGTVVVTPTGGSGVGATMSVTTSGGAGSASVTGITVVMQGSGYNIGDVLTIANTSLPGPPSNNVLITLQEQDRSIVNASWVPTLRPVLIPSTGNFFVASKMPHAAIRLRVESTGGNLRMTNFRIMCNS